MPKKNKRKVKIEKLANKLKKQCQVSGEPSTADPIPLPDPAPLSDTAPLPGPAPLSDTAPLPDPTPLLDPTPLPGPAPLSDTAPLPDPTPLQDPTPQPDPATTPLPDPALLPTPTPLPDPAPTPLPDPAPLPARTKLTDLAPTPLPDPALLADPTPLQDSTPLQDPTPLPGPAPLSDTAPLPDPTPLLDPTPLPGPARLSDTAPLPDPTPLQDPTLQPDPATTSQLDPALLPTLTPLPDPAPLPTRTKLTDLAPTPLPDPAPTPLPDPAPLPAPTKLTDPTPLLDLTPRPKIILQETIEPELLNKWPKLKSKIPPIFLHRPYNFEHYVKNVLDMEIKFYQPIWGKNFTKITCASEDDHQKMSKYFKKRQLSFHTFGYPLERKMKVVLKGIPKETELSKIQEALTLAKIPITRVHKMHTKVEKKDNTMLVLAVVPHDDEGKAILKVIQVLEHNIQLEPLNDKPKQCHRCQKWGHSQRYCYGKIKCVKCAGDHFTNKCDKLEDEPPKCANCNGDHTANYKRCIFGPDSEQYQMKQEDETTVQYKPNQIVTVENCHTLYKNVDYSKYFCSPSNHPHS